MIEKISLEEMRARASVIVTDEPCAWCDGMGADVDAEPIQTGAHSVSWVGSMSKCTQCGGTGLQSVPRGQVRCSQCKALYPFGTPHVTCKIAPEPS